MRLLFLLLCVALPVHAQAPADGPPELVNWTSTASAALYWTQLPGPQFESAVLRTSDGRAVAMELHERVGNFAILRLEDSSGEGWANYVGPQKLNETGPLGARRVQTIEGLQRLPPPENAGGPIGGVSAADLSVAMTIVYEDGGRTAIGRSVGGVGVADVIVNGAPVSLDVYVIEVKAQSPGMETPIVNQAVYAPALGVAVRGVFLQPERVEWRLESIQAPNEVFARLRPSAAQPSLPTLSVQPPGP